MKKSFSKLFPYLNYWVENHGYIQLGSGDENEGFLTIVDDGRVCWEDEGSKTIDQALAKAEKHLDAVACVFTSNIFEYCPPFCVVS